MGLRSVHSTISQNDHDETLSALEMHNLQDTPHELPARQMKTKTHGKRQFLHPAAWILLLCIGGPILLHELSNIYLVDGFSSLNSRGLRLSTIACDVHQPWTSWSTLFEINLRTGNLSFTAAKLIDIAFDIVVGRVGQACLAWISYRVYTDILIRITEGGQMRYDLFAAIALRPNEIKTLGAASRSVPSAKKLWTKFTLVWTVLAMLYVLAYPTLVSATTSLVAATTRSVQLNNNGTAPIESYVNSASYSFAESGLDQKPDPWIVSVDDINMLGRDMCNIMFFRQHQWSIVGGNVVSINETTYDLSNKTQTTCGFYYGNVFYPADMATGGNINTVDRFFASQVICLPDGQNYQWGASWELLILILILQIVWSTSLLFMWLEVTMHSPLVRQGRKMGTWRAILDLAGPLIVRLGPDEGMLSQVQLEDSIRGMPLVHYEVKVDGTDEGGGPRNVHLVSGFDGAVTMPQ